MRHCPLTPGPHPAPPSTPDVHGLLGDVAMESDDFGTALAELDAALRYLQTFVQARGVWGPPPARLRMPRTWHAQGSSAAALLCAHMHGPALPTTCASKPPLRRHPQPLLQEDDRRIAEVQYKRCCALQFSGEVEQALPAVQVGRGGCEARNTGWRQL